MSSPDGGFVPASPPPPGVTPDFVNGESIAYRLFVVAIFFSVLALVFVSARLFIALSLQKKWCPDDGKWPPRAVPRSSVSGSTLNKHH